MDASQTNAKLPPSLPDALTAYPDQTSGYDEMWSAEGAKVHQHWQPLMQDLLALGGGELARRRIEARRLLRENGVTYHIYSDPKGQQRTWQLDPIPLVLDSTDWDAISAGLKQRARLMNLILKDLYSERRLISEGLIPAELIFAHSGFLRACDKIVLPDNTPALPLYAVDLARGPDGRMWVIGDRTQSPSGIGYALESRMAMTRVMAEEFRRTQVHRLSIFFRNLRTMLASLSTHHSDDPRVVILTPGPHNETYFEHAYLASYLGYSLVQGEDLTVRDNKVWMKSLDGLKQVDIIVRRVDDSFCDPLELREDSHLGVPGLLQAVRQGNVVIANPLGSSILESPGLLPFLPAIARARLGEELLLPSAATWWCGHETERAHVLERMDELVLKPIDRRENSVFGAQLTDAQKVALRARILAAPHLWVGQEIVSCSTAPSLREQQIVPRRVLIRAFLTAHEKDYDVMPGGLTRVAQNENELFISNQTGGLSKDTWIQTERPVHQTSLWPTLSQLTALVAREGILPSRSGENLFWVGRYAERTEGLLRLIRSTLNKLADYDDYRDESDQVVLEHLLMTLTHFTQINPGLIDDPKKAALKKPHELILDMVLGKEHYSSLINMLGSFMQSAYNVRDLWSVDTWRVIDGIDEMVQQLGQHKQNVFSLPGHLDKLLVSLMAFTGQTQESMPHEHGWHLLNIGRRVERALQLIVFMRTCFVNFSGEVPEHLLLEATLINHQSLITHRRRYRSVQHIFTVLDLMLLDKRYPRSLAYQINKIAKDMQALPNTNGGLPSHHLSPEQRLILETSTDMQLAQLDKLTALSGTPESRKGLAKLLDNTESRLERLAELLHQKYFTHTQRAQQLAPTGR